MSQLTSPAPLHVVLFSGGRGSGALAELLANDPRVDLTVAINGYDDGASTGAVRRFLGDALGPSDFRKNASRFARLRRSCDGAIIDLLDKRLPVPAGIDDLRRLREQPGVDHRMATALRRFEEEFARTGRPIDFDDASVGNFVFAGCYLEAGRRFNDAVDRYCALVGLPSGLIENVTDGTNAYLVALDVDGVVLGSEEEIVDAKRRNRVKEIYLIDGPLDETARVALATVGHDARGKRLAARTVAPPLNPRLAARLSHANLIIYAPGTQHSSLFPSYLTPGLGQAIAMNLEATKLLVTNIQEDAEIAGSSAVDLIDRAVFYLRDKGRLTTPVPCLITHYLVNDPSGAESPDKRYVPLGRLDSLEDPRLVRVANYEAGVTGRHDATRVLAPFIEGFIARSRSIQRVAVVLGETRSPNKLAQTLLEMVRGGISSLPVELSVFCAPDAELDTAFVERLPFPVVQLRSAKDDERDRELRAAIDAGAFQYVVLFDSAGMYNGEDIPGLVSHLAHGRLDAVWGSRRLSVRDIEESYRLRYRDQPVQGAISAMGSHILSLQYLFLYGRYVADTLSGARAVRAEDALGVECRLDDSVVNHHLLSRLLRRRAEILEIPVGFFAISPDQVRRTSVGDGVRSVGIAVSRRFRRPTRPATRA